MNKKIQLFTDLDAWKEPQKFVVKICIATFFLLLASFFLFPNTASAGVIHRTSNNLGLVGYWTFNGDDMINNVRDRSGQDNNGEIINQTATSTIEGKIGQALEFDGSDDQVRISDTTDPTAYTISAWVKPTDNTSVGIFVRTNSGGPTTNYSHQLRIDGSSNFVHYTHDGSTNTLAGTTAVVANTWYHVVGVAEDVGTMRLYVNGVEEGTPISLDGALNTSGDRYRIGTESGGSIDFFNGAIDDVRLYNRVLTATEVSKLHQSGKSRIKTVSTDGLVGHWKFDDESGTQASDSSGNGNNGTLTLMEESDWVNGKRGGALDFDGSNDYVLLPDIGLTEGTAYTISFWAQKLSASANPAVYSEGTPANWNNNLIIIYYGDSGDSNGVRVWYRDSGGVGGSILSYPTDVTGSDWHHVVFVQRSSSDRELFIDSISADTDTISRNAPVVTSASIGAGNNNGTFDQFTDAIIDEVRVYNRDLSVAEILDLYNSNALKFQSTQDRLLTDGLVGYWSFNGKNLVDNVADSSGQGNNGTISGQTNATSTVEGKVGQALDFDGTDDYVNVVDSTSFDTGTGPLSFTFWFKLDSAFDNTIVSSQPILSKYTSTNFNFFVALIGTEFPSGSVTDGSLSFKIDGDGFFYTSTTQASWEANRWYFAVVTRNLGVRDMYIDGVNDTGAGGESNPELADFNDVTADFQIGGGTTESSGSAFVDYFNGSIDEVRIYNRVLSADEILRLYNMGQ